MKIIEVTENKKQYLDLLLLADDEYSAGSEPLYPLERATLSAW